MVKKSMILGMTLALGLFFIGLTSQCLAEEEGLVAWWKFDEGEGNIAKDSSGNNNKGTLRGSAGPTWIKNGLEFDGKDDYVTVPGSESLDITEEITIEAWVKHIDSCSYNNVIIAGKAWFFGVRDSGVHFLVDRDPARYSKIHSYWNIVLIGRCGLKPGVFNHIAGTYDSETGTARVYANGKCVGSKVGDDVPTQRPGTFYIGNKEGRGSYMFRGTIAEVKIYNKCLNGEEIKKRYADEMATRGKMEDL